MKKVITHGNKYTIYKITCDCGCVFTYEVEDIIGIFGDRPWVRCPECDAGCEHYDAEVIKNEQAQDDDGLPWRG